LEQEHEAFKAQMQKDANDLEAREQALKAK